MSVQERIATAWQGYWHHVSGVTNPPTDEDREWASVLLAVLGRAGLDVIDAGDFEIVDYECVDGRWTVTPAESGGRSYCSGCPDHEACSTGTPCSLVQLAEAQRRLRQARDEQQVEKTLREPLSRGGRRSDSGLSASDPMHGGARTVDAVANHRSAPPTSPSLAVTEPGSVPEPSNTGSGCSSKDDRGLPSACFRCGAAIWNGNVHRNGQTECDMWQVPGV